RERLLQPRVERSRERESRATIGEGGHRLDPLIEAWDDDHSRERLAVLIARNRTELEAFRKLVHADEFDRKCTVAEQPAAREYRGVGVDEQFAKNAIVVLFWPEATARRRSLGDVGGSASREHEPHRGQRPRQFEASGSQAFHRRVGEKVSILSE